MCKGQASLVVVMILLILGLALAVIGLATPYWQSGSGLDLGLFHQCRGLRCEVLDYDEPVLYFVDVIIVLGVASIALSFGAALHLWVQKCQKQKMSPGPPKCVAVGCVLGAFCVVVGVIVYCAAVYDEDKYSFKFSPWITLVAAFVCGITGYIVQRIFTKLSQSVAIYQKQRTEEIELQSHEDIAHISFRHAELTAGAHSPEEGETPNLQSKNHQDQRAPPLTYFKGYGFANSSSKPFAPTTTTDSFTGIEKIPPSSARSTRDSQSVYDQYPDPTPLPPPPKKLSYSHETIGSLRPVTPVLPATLRDPIPNDQYERDPEYVPVDNRVDVDDDK